MMLPKNTVVGLLSRETETAQARSSALQCRGWCITMMVQCHAIATASATVLQSYCIAKLMLAPTMMIAAMAKSGAGAHK